ncbi:unnamed protein product [Boreogadus saida]
MVDRVALGRSNHFKLQQTPTFKWRPTGEHFLRDLRMDVEKPIGFDTIMRVRTSTEFGVIPVHRDTELFAYGGCGPVGEQSWRELNPRLARVSRIGHPNPGLQCL